MKPLSTTIKVLTCTIFIMALSSLAQAQATRTWVSGVGDDVNPCSRTAPCKTYAGAISKTAEGGEISVLDPGGYGTLTITKAITVDGGTGSGWGSTLAAATSGFTVNVTTGVHAADAIVILRNLSINGANQTPSPGISGIRYLKAKALHIENCTIFGFNTRGIDVNISGSNGFLGVENTTIENTTTGIRTAITGGNLNGSINNVVLKEQATGLDVVNGTFTISNSVITNNSTAGITVGAAGVANVDSNIVSNNGVGISASAVGAVVRINNNSVYKNTTGLSNSGTMQTYRNNKVVGNGTNLTGALTDISPIGNGIQ
ncbi:MAG TPA: hypothetical protein VF723_11140 [Pyrinomonadaceae bacterium]|jgi:hypothetical protein